MPYWGPNEFIAYNVSPVFSFFLLGYGLGSGILIVTFLILDFFLITILEVLETLYLVFFEVILTLCEPVLNFLVLNMATPFLFVLII